MPNTVEKIIKLINEKKPLSFSGIEKQRLASFISSYLGDQSEDFILKFYEYVLEYYLQKGWRLRPSHFYTPKILAFKENVTHNIKCPDYYHKLYSKRFVNPREPYDVQLKPYIKFASYLLNAPRIIYTPSAGLYIEDGIYLVKATGLGYEHYDNLMKAWELLYNHPKREVRDYSHVWREKPFWKALIPLEYFVTLYGTFTYNEFLLLVELKEDPRLYKKLEEFEKKYQEYTEFLPPPRRTAIQAINLVIV